MRSIAAIVDVIQTMIELRDIAFTYPASDFSLSVPTLSIDAGQRIAVVGPSGSGKTTLLNLLAGILVPDAGTVRVNEVEVASLSDAARRKHRLSSIGMVFQAIELVDYLSVIDNVLLPARINRAVKLDNALRDRAAQLLERVGLSGMRQRRVSDLSQGERQRVGICRALIASPSVILADEPTSALDEERSDEVLSLLMEVVAEAGATLVMLTHDRSLLDRFDGVVRVADGVAAMLEELSASTAEASP